MDHTRIEFERVIAGRIDADQVARVRAVAPQCHIVLTVTRHLVWCEKAADDHVTVFLIELFVLPCIHWCILVALSEQSGRIVPQRQLACNRRMLPTNCTFRYYTIFTLSISRIWSLSVETKKRFQQNAME